MVQYAPYIAQQWEVDINEQLGYEPMDVTPATHEEVAADAEQPCELCVKTTDEEEMVLCDTCCRGYHLQCLPLRHRPASLDNPGEWQCKECST